MEFPFLLQDFVVLAVVAGILAVDDRAGWQSLVAQPVFASVVIGLVLGELDMALAVGIVVEMVWLAVLPMRGTQRPDAVVGTVVGVATACLLVHDTGDPRFAFVASIGVFVALACGEAAGALTRFVYVPKERFLAGFISAGQSAVDDGQVVRRLVFHQAVSLVYVIVVHALFVLGLLPVALYLADLFAGARVDAVAPGLVVWYELLPAFGAAALIQIHWHKHLNRFLVVSAVTFWVILWIR